jgi:hypothetical protein
MPPTNWYRHRPLLKFTAESAYLTINVPLSQTKDIPAMKERMESRVAELTDLATSLRETYCMAEEEARSVAVLIQDATKRSKDDQQIEWLEKLVTATRIQSQDAQRRLAALQSRR